MRAVVVGGGLAGMSAAMRLHDAGISVTLIEAEAELGGKARSLQVSGHILDLGPQSFIGRREIFWPFLARLGLECEQLGSRYRTRFVVRDHELRALASPASLLRVLSPKELVGLLREPFAAASEGEVSVRDFCLQRFGAGGAFIAEALVCGIYAGDPSRLSMSACFPALVAWERRDGSLVRGAWRSRQQTKNGRPGTYTVKGGLGAIGQRVATILGDRVRLNSPVARIGPKVVTLASGATLAADLIVLATEAPVAATIAPEPLASELAAFTYAPISVVHWQGDAGAPRGFGYVAPEGEGAFTLGSVFAGDLRESQTRYFATLIGGAWHPERAALDDQRLLEGLAGDRARFGLGECAQVLHVQRWPHAVIQPHIGHEDRVKQARAAARRAGIVLAGAYLGAGAMHDALKSGEDAADEGLSCLQAPPPHPAPAERERGSCSRVARGWVRER